MNETIKKIYNDEHESKKEENFINELKSHPLISS